MGDKVILVRRVKADGQRLKAPRKTKAYDYLRSLRIGNTSRIRRLKK